jgi:hypothetical protein
VLDKQKARQCNSLFTPLLFGQLWAMAFQPDEPLRTSQRQQGKALTRRLLLFASAVAFLCFLNFSSLRQFQNLLQQQQQDVPLAPPVASIATRNNHSSISGATTRAAMLSQCSAEFIVNETYSNVYQSFVDQCPTDDYKKKCDFNHTAATNNVSTPWWLQSLIDKPASHLLSEGSSYHHIWFDDPPIRYYRIEKVASDSWREIRKLVDRDFRNISSLGGGERRRASNAGTSWPQKTDQFPRVVFFRDPLERLLSGYIDKCIIPYKRIEGHCQPDSVYDLRGGFSKRQGLQSYLLTMPLSWNVHFVPQAMFCGGLFRTWQDYEFVGSMNDGQFEHDMRSLTERFPGPLMEYVRDQFPFLKDNSTNFRATLADQGILHATGASKRVQEYYNPESVRIALQYFSIDYVTLNLTIPEWIQDILDEDCRKRFGYTASERSGLH